MFVHNQSVVNGCNSFFFFLMKNLLSDSLQNCEIFCQRTNPRVHFYKYVNQATVSENNFFPPGSYLELPASCPVISECWVSTMFSLPPIGIHIILRRTLHSNFIPILALSLRCLLQPTMMYFLHTHLLPSISSFFL